MGGVLDRKDRESIQGFLDNCDDNYKRIPIKMEVKFQMQHKNFPENKGSVAINIEGINSSRLMGKFINKLEALAKEIREDDNFEQHLLAQRETDSLT